MYYKNNTGGQLNVVVGNTGEIFKKDETRFIPDELDHYIQNAIQSGFALEQVEGPEGDEKPPATPPATPPKPKPAPKKTSKKRNIRARSTS